MTPLVILSTVVIGALLGGLLKLARLPFDYVIYGLYALGFVAVLKVVTGPAPVEDAAPLLLGGADIWEIAGFITLGVMLGYVATLQKFAFPKFEMPGLGDWKRPTFAKPKPRKRRVGAVSEGQRIYLTTALKFGALVAASDRDVQPREYSALISFFKIDAGQFPEAREIYRQQLSQPQRMIDVLAPFIQQFGLASAICETFLMGMCQVALADGEVHRSELSLLRLAGERLGLNPLDVSRILYAAGLLEEESETQYDWARSDGNSNGGQSRNGAGSRFKPKLSEREQHLAVLGLEGSPSPAEIKAAYRALARKYHPDKLASQDLPEDEMDRAEALMVTINQAYEYLKD